MLVQWVAGGEDALSDYLIKGLVFETEVVVREGKSRRRRRFDSQG